jgi:hypothetical protein
MRPNVYAYQRALLKGLCPLDSGNHPCLWCSAEWMWISREGLLASVVCHLFWESPGTRAHEKQQSWSWTASPSLDITGSDIRIDLCTELEHVPEK